MSTRPALAGFAGMDQDGPRPGRRVDPDASVETLPGVGPKVAERLGRLGAGVRTVRDAVEHIPRDFLDWRQASGFSALMAGEDATVSCMVERARLRPTRRRNLKIVEARVVDESGAHVTAIWFNQAYLADQLKPGTRLLLHGRLEGGGYGAPTFRVERHERAEAGAGLHTVGLVPVYPATEELATGRVREIADRALVPARFFPDPLPAPLRIAESLPTLADALRAAHQPRGRDEADAARRRLAFQELLMLQIGLRRRRRELEEGARAPALGEEGELIGRYRAALPFELTPEQEQAVGEIRHDLAGERPMQRLLQGDVGSGKTVVALYALLRAVEQRHQGALMAPTETLAEQHFLTVEGICSELGVRAVLLTSSLAARDAEQARTALADGKADLAVGTHALIQESVAFRSLAVAVVDEQHRFGVEQRRALGAQSPHVLHMTATPIPRTLAQTVYGDLDVTEIARPPRDRKPIKTAWVPAERSTVAYERLRKHLAQGRQAYVVCPLVTESEASEARAAEQEAERLRGAELQGFRVGCLHGRLRPSDRRGIMAAFKRRELDVLVATTVIEVGVDVPNATIMIVQEADRFGLAQLHQLRGRVGRGAEQSFCLLVSRGKEELTETARRRLEALVEIVDGFRLAEIDLELRGEGQLLGTRQSGLPDLRFASLTGDRELVVAARRWAEALEDEQGPLSDEVDRLFADADHRGFA
ncbi:MAG TPA: ATP-dependent DNA helicase RecG [Gaiellaceae bacterium]